MNRSMTLTSILIVLSILLISAQARSATGQYSSTSSSPSTASRTTNLTVKLVFLGINSSQVDLTYLRSPVNLPQGKFQTVSQEGVDTGVFYNFTYQPFFANASVTQSFVSYLGTPVVSVQTTLDRSITPASQWNPYFSNSTSGIRYLNTAFYNATAVEAWFATNYRSFGTAPVPGYTLFIADLHNYNITVPSFTYQEYKQDKCQGLNPCSQVYTATLHYYNRTVVDQDLGGVGTRHYMTGWGGNERFYYTDISAGPSYWTGEQPVQVAAGLEHVDLSRNYARTWLTQVVADYVGGAVYNLFAPDQLYPVTYSQQYVFHLFVFDNRTQAERAAGPSVQQALNASYIRSQLSTLAPYASITVTPIFANIEDYPNFASVVAGSTTGLYDPSFGHHVVDARPIWDWLSTYSQGNIKTFLPTRHGDTTQIDIPAFIFVFQSDYNFGFTDHGSIFKPNTEGVQSIFGVALPDMALISHGQSDLTGNQATPGTNEKGLGLTGTVVHELGHEMGLEHPFNYDPTEDFVDSVMAYYPGSTHYSQFDRDNVLRGINDELLGFAQAELAVTGSNLFNLGQIATARNELNIANIKYNQMDYQGAVQDSLSAATNAQQARALSAFGFGGLGTAGYTIIGLAVGALVGLLIGYLLFERRRRTYAYATPGATSTSAPAYQYGRCPTCGQSLRWDPMMMQWYCDNCKHFVKQ